MIRFFCLVAAGLSLTSCLSKDANVCTATQIEPVSSAVGPKTASVNQTVTYTINYAPLSTCGDFDGFVEQAGATANTRVVGTRVKYSSCDCPASTAVKLTTYTLKPTQAGTYYLNFISTTGYIADTLVVQ